MTPWRWPWNTPSGNGSRSPLFALILSFLLLCPAGSLWGRLVPSHQPPGRRRLQRTGPSGTLLASPGAVRTRGHGRQTGIPPQEPDAFRRGAGPFLPQKRGHEELIEGSDSRQGKILSQRKPVDSGNHLLPLRGAERNRRFHPADRDPPRRVPGRKDCLQSPRQHGALYGS